MIRVDESIQEAYWPAFTDSQASSVHKNFWCGKKIVGGLDEKFNEKFIAYSRRSDALDKACSEHKQNNMKLHRQKLRKESSELLYPHVTYE